MTGPARKLVTFPADLLAEIKRRAEEQGVSANSLIVNLVAGGVNFKLRQGGWMPALSIWGSEVHVEQVAERLGHFEVRHLEHELQMTGTPVRKRLAVMLKNGVVVEESPARGNNPASYRWVGPSN